MDTDPAHHAPCRTVLLQKSREVRHLLNVELFRAVVDTRDSDGPCDGGALAQLTGFKSIRGTRRGHALWIQTVAGQRVYGSLFHRLGRIRACRLAVNLVHGVVSGAGRSD